jgi:hypothetical protein
MHGHGQAIWKSAAFTETRSMHMNIQKGHGQAAWTDMDMNSDKYYVLVHAAWT